MRKNTFVNDAGETDGAMCISFVHHKGGTGKTTACINTAGWLSKMGRKVLVVDLDPQGNATTGLGIDRASCDKTVYDVLFQGTPIEEAIIDTNWGINLLPSSIDLLAAETHMAGQVNNTMLLKRRLKSILYYYDYILIDVPPGSTLLMINGIVASENIIIPVDAGVFAYETMDTLKTLIIDLQKEIGVEVNVMMVLVKGYTDDLFSNGPAREIKKLMKGFLDENVVTGLKIISVPFSVKIYKAQMKGAPISHYAPFSNIGRVYKKIAKSVMRYASCVFYSCRMSHNEHRR